MMASPGRIDAPPGQRRRVLVANDDGPSSSGLWVLVRALCADHEVEVVCPAREQSGTGHGFTFGRPLTVQQENHGPVGVWIVDGLPADAVKWGLTRPGARRPDLVVSGVNPGENAGVCASYSGTVACAREAALFGIPAIAVSSSSDLPEQLEAAAHLVVRLIGIGLPHLPPGSFWNLNCPATRPQTWGEPVICPGGTAMFDDTYDPRPADGTWLLRGTKPPPAPDAEDDDGWLLRGRPTLVPLRTDATDHETLARLRSARSPEIS